MLIHRLRILGPRSFRKFCDVLDVTGNEYLGQHLRAEGNRLMSLCPNWDKEDLACRHFHTSFGLIIVAYRLSLPFQFHRKCHISMLISIFGYIIIIYNKIKKWSIYLIECTFLLVFRAKRFNNDHGDNR